MKFYSVYKYLFFAVLALPIVALPNSVPDWDKTIIFRILMTAVISLFLWDIFKNREGLAIRERIWQIKTPFILLSIFFLLLLLSVIFSQDVSFSLWGSPYRAGGFVTYSFYIFFALLAFLIIKPGDWEKLLSWSLVVGWAVSLTAVFQSFGILKNFLVSYNGGGAPSTTGNSILLALYCLMLFFVSLAFFLRTNKKKQKIFYALTCGLFAFTILLANERASFLGLIAGLFYFIFFYPLPAGRQGKKNKWLGFLRIGGVAALAAAAAIVIYINSAPKLPDFVEQNNFLRNISAKLSIRLVVSESRFSGWQVMLNAAKEKPMLGWGPENLQMGYDKHYDPNLPQITGLWWDKAHNFMMEIAVSSGIPALFAFLLFFIYLFWQLQKIKKRGNNVLAHMIQTGFLAYFIADFFSIDGFTSYIILFLLVGLSLHFIIKEKGYVWTETKNFQPKKNKIIPAAIIFLASIFILFFNILPFKTNIAIGRAENLASAKECGQAVSLMDGVLNDKNFVAPYSRLKYAEILKNCGEAQRAFTVLKQNIKDQPKLTRLWISLAGFGNVLLSQEQDPQKKQELTETIQSYEKQGLLLSPKREEIYLEINKTYYVIKNYPAMEQNSKDCLKISDKFSGCWWYLGIAEIFQGRQKDGKEHIAMAETRFAPIYFQLADAYISQKNYISATDAYYHIVRNYPDNADYRATLAFLYKQIGDYTSAGAEAFKIFELQPENAEAQKFLKQLSVLSPDDPTLHFSLGLMYKKLNNEPQMLKELHSAEEVYWRIIAAKNMVKKNTGGEHLGLAEIYKELENFSKAREEALLALKLRPNFKAEVEELLKSLPE